MLFVIKYWLSSFLWEIFSDCHDIRTEGVILVLKRREFNGDIAARHLLT